MSDARVTGQIPLSALKALAKKTQGATTMVAPQPAPQAESSISYDRGIVRPVTMPRVSALMVIGQPQRLNTARVTMSSSWVPQDYPNKQLVIINSTGQRVTNRPHPDIVEQLVEPVSVGAAMNLALELADGDYLIRWDDDEHSHPRRISYQMLHRQPDRVVMLRRHLRLQYPQATAFVHEDDQGILSTMLWPRSIARFADLNEGFDAEFLAGTFHDCCAVIDNTNPGPELHLSVYHGLNLTPVAEFMAGHVGPEHEGKGPSSPFLLRYLAEACKPYNMPVEFQLEAGDPAELAAHSG